MTVSIWFFQNLSIGYRFVRCLVDFCVLPLPTWPARSAGSMWPWKPTVYEGHPFSNNGSMGENPSSINHQVEGWRCFLSEAGDAPLSHPSDWYSSHGWVMNVWVLLTCKDLIAIMQRCLPGEILNVFYLKKTCQALPNHILTSAYDGQKQWPEVETHSLKKVLHVASNKSPPPKKKNTRDWKLKRTHQLPNLPCFGVPEPEI